MNDYEEESEENKKYAAKVSEEDKKKVRELIMKKVHLQKIKRNNEKTSFEEEKRSC